MKKEQPYDFYLKIFLNTLQKNLEYVDTFAKKIIWGKCEIVSEVVLYSVFKKKITQTEVSFFFKFSCSC